MECGIWLWLVSYPRRSLSIEFLITFSLRSLARAITGDELGTRRGLWAVHFAYFLITIYKDNRNNMNNTSRNNNNDNDKV